MPEKSLLRSHPLARLVVCLAALMLGLATIARLPAQAVRVPEATPDASQQPPADESASPPPAASPSKAINLFELAIAGGIFMIPIAGMSLLAVTMAIERGFAIRRSRVMPDGLMNGLGEMTQRSSGFDLAKALKLCRQFPSPAANVYRVVLGRAGSPLAELESAMSHTAQREADKLYGNVRWLNTAASLSTLLGLIGTIQGMIMAFHQLTVMDATSDRTLSLAAGIYTALVTTFAGLAVAIPTLLVSHVLETRVIKLFHEIEERGLDFLPRLSSREHAARQTAMDDNGDGAAASIAAALPSKPAHLL